MALVEASVFISMRPPSQNKFQGHHWRTYYHRYRKKWQEALSTHLGEGQHNDRLREVCITVYHPSPRNYYDYANFVGGCKPIPDALKTLGWIRDDSPKWFSCVYHQKVVGNDGTDTEGTRIDLYSQETTQEAAVRLRTSGWSYRRIAAHLDTNHMAVKRAVGGTLVTPGKSIGIDGKRYPATRSRGETIQ